MGTRQAETLFNEFQQWGYDHKGWAPKTRLNYLYLARRADRHVRAHSTRSVFSASVKDLQKFLFSLKPKASTRNLARQSLVGFYDFLIDKGWRDDNPAQALPVLQVPETLPKPIRPELVAAALRASRVFGPMVEAMVHLYAYTGLRRDEVRCLGWAAWLEAEGILDVTVTKQRKDRRIPLHVEAQEALRRWRAKCDNAEVMFPSPRNPRRSISDTWVEKTIREVGSMAGIDRLHPHVFRHSLATYLLQQGYNLKVVQKVLGHSTVAATEKYLLVVSSETKEAFTSVDWETPEG